MGHFFGLLVLEGAALAAFLFLAALAAPPIEAILERSVEVNFLARAGPPLRPP